MDDTPKWQVSPALKLSWRTWGDDTVVYHHGSGDTHKLNPLSAQALRLLQSQPRTAHDLTQQLAAAIGQVADDQLLRYTEKLMDHFDQLGLIEPAA